MNPPPLPPTPPGADSENLSGALGAPPGSGLGRIVLHNRSGGSANNIDRTYTVNLSNEPLDGTWKLRVNDNYDNDTGRIDSWSITF